MGVLQSLCLPGEHLSAPLPQADLSQLVHAQPTSDLGEHKGASWVLAHFSLKEFGCETCVVIPAESVELLATSPLWALAKSQLGV